MGCGAMTRFIEGESPTVLRRLPSSLAGGLSQGPMGVATQEDMIAVERKGLPSRDLPIRPRSSRGLRPFLTFPRLSHAGSRPVRCSSRGLQPLLRFPRPSHPGSRRVRCSSRGLQPLLTFPRPSHPGSLRVLDVKESREYRVRQHLAELALASRRGSRAIEAMKVCRVPQPAVLRPKAPKSPPPVKVPAGALRAVAGLASER